MSEKDDPKIHDDEVDLTEEYEESEDDPTPPEVAPKSAATEAPSAAIPAPAAAPAAASSAEKGSMGDVPFTLVIEAARLPLTLDKLLQLQKGNVLELPHTPEQGVDIVVSGTCIARGELVKIGDRLAVRILDI